MINIDELLNLNSIDDIKMKCLEKLRELKPLIDTSCESNIDFFVYSKIHAITNKSSSAIELKKEINLFIKSSRQLSHILNNK